MKSKQLYKTGAIDVRWLCVVMLVTTLANLSLGDLGWRTDSSGGVYFPDGVYSNRINENTVQIDFTLANLVTGDTSTAYSNSTNPSNGIWYLDGINNGQSRYLPNPGYYGNDFFTFVVTQQAVALTGTIKFVIIPATFNIAVYYTNATDLTSFTNVTTVSHGDNSTMVISATNLDWNLVSISLDGSDVPITNYNRMVDKIVDVDTNHVYHIIGDYFTPPTMSVTPPSYSVIGGMQQIIISATQDATYAHAISELKINRRRLEPSTVMYRDDNITIPAVSDPPNDASWTNFAITNVTYGANKWTLYFNTTNYHDWDPGIINGDYDLLFAVYDEAGDSVSQIPRYYVDNNPLGDWLSIESITPNPFAKVDNIQRFSLAANLSGSSYNGLSRSVFDIYGPLHDPNTGSLLLPADNNSPLTNRFTGHDFGLDNLTSTPKYTNQQWRFDTDITDTNNWPNGEYKITYTVYDNANKSVVSSQYFYVNHEGIKTNGSNGPFLDNFTPPEDTLLSSIIKIEVDANEGLYRLSDMYLNLYGPHAHITGTNRAENSAINIRLPADDNWIRTSISSLNDNHNERGRVYIPGNYNNRKLGLLDNANINGTNYFTGYNPASMTWTLLFNTDNSMANIWDDYTNWEFTVSLKDLAGNMWGHTNLDSADYTNINVFAYYEINNKQLIDVQFWSDWGSGYEWSSSNQYCTFTGTNYVYWGSNITAALAISNGWHVMSNMVSNMYMSATEPASNNNINATNNFALGAVTNDTYVRIYMDIDRYSLIVTSAYDVTTPSVGIYSNIPWTNGIELTVNQTNIFRTNYKGVTNEVSAYNGLIVYDDDNGSAPALFNGYATNYTLGAYSNNIKIELEWDSRYKFVVNSDSDIASALVYVSSAAPVTNYNEFATNQTPVRIVATNIAVDHVFLYWQKADTSVFSTDRDHSFSFSQPMEITPILRHTTGTNFNDALTRGSISATNQQYSTYGDAAWFIQTNVYYTNGMDKFAAQSGAINDNQMSVLQTEVVGPADVSFMWKVDSEGGGDYLRFMVNTQKMAEITGTKNNWTNTMVSLPNGSHALKWIYEKDSNDAGGMDAGWVDEIYYHLKGDIRVSLMPDVVTNIAQWRLMKGQGSWTNWMDADEVALNIPEGTNIVEIKNLANWVEPRPISMTVNRSTLNTVQAELFYIDITNGVDAPFMQWTSSGDKEWYTQSNVYYVAKDNHDAIQSGPISHDERSIMMGYAPQPGWISFYVKTDCELNLDILSFAIDGVTNELFSGKTSSWQRVEYPVSGMGAHTFKWEYKKDYSVNVGTDRCWVDMVQYARPVEVSISAGSTYAQINGVTNNEYFPIGNVVTASLQILDGDATFNGWYKNGGFFTASTSAVITVDWTNSYIANVTPPGYTSEQYNVVVPYDWMTNWFTNSDPIYISGQVTNMPAGSPYTYQEHYIIGVAPTSDALAILMPTNILTDAVDTNYNVIWWYAETNRDYRIEYATTLGAFGDFVQLPNATGLPLTVISMPQHVAYTDTVNEASRQIYYRLRVKIKDAREN